MSLTDSDLWGSPAAPVPQDTAIPNNNPVNVRPLPNGQWTGQVGVAPNGMAIFDTPQNGWNAGDQNMIAAIAKHGRTTLNQIIGAWAPQGDGANDPAAYVSKVASALGVKGDDPAVGLRVLSDPGFRHNLLQTMASKVEIGKPVTFGSGQVGGAENTGMTDQDVWGQAAPDNAAATPASAAPQGRTDFGLGVETGLRKPLDNLGTWIGDALRAIPGVHPGTDDATLERLTGAPASTAQVVANAAAQGRTPGQGGTAVGEGAMTLPLQFLAKNPILGGAAAGAVTTPDPNNLGATALNAGEGALAALGGSAALKAAGTAISPVLSPAVQRLKDLGVQMTSGQLLQGIPKTLEDTATSIPLVENLVRGAQDNSITSFNRAVVNAGALAPIGKALPATVAAGHDAINYAAGELGKVFNQATAMLPPKISVDTPLVQGLETAGDVLKNAPAEIQAQYRSIINHNFWSQVGGDDVTTPQAAQHVGSQLGFLSRSFSRSADPNQQLLGHALDAANDELHDWVGRINPAVAPQLSAARTGWANLVRIMGASGRAGTNSGVFTPSHLMQAVNAADTSPLVAGSRQAIAKGQGLLQGIAEDGKSVLPNKVPDSGAALRTTTALAMLGVPAAIAAKVISGPAGWAPAAAEGVTALGYTAPVQKALRAAIGATRPAAVRAVGSGVRALAPIGAALGGVLGPAQAQAQGLLHGLFGQ